MADIRERTQSICSILPGAELTHPRGDGHDAWKICGKMFASFGSKSPGVAVKTFDIETASMLIEAGVAHRAKYFHRSWINLPEGTDFAELNHRLIISYDIVRRGLTKKMQATLAPREEI
ncbi:MAG: MmcQ/YjbR family DNA-binding protein [Paracoccaceae bacterium]|jgi:predicted DNA-binding protein (MmcQ/YjbR family)|nr:MmcQ/YjbR family DNA-binding protein [Paracoccaceae bacterium]